METLKLVSALVILFSTFNSFCQERFLVPKDRKVEINSEKLRIRYVDVISIEDGGELYVKNSIVHVKNLMAWGDYGIHLSNSIIIWEISTNVKGYMVTQRGKGKMLKDILVDTKNNSLVIKKMDKVEISGAYNNIKYKYLSQGIYDVFCNGKLVDILYVL